MAEPRLSRYLHSKAAAAGFPVAGNFELTPRCNFNCKMCYVHLSEAEQRRRGKELTADQWLSIGEAACREGLLFLLLTGGEPTLRPDFPEILSGLKRMGLLISVNSNGFPAAWRTVRDAIRDVRYPKACTECRFRGICQICLAKCYCETLGFDEAPRYACRMTRALLEELEIPCRTEVLS